MAITPVNATSASKLTLQLQEQQIFKQIKSLQQRDAPGNAVQIKALQQKYNALLLQHAELLRIPQQQRNASGQVSAPQTKTPEASDTPSDSPQASEGIDIRI